MIPHGRWKPSQWKHPSWSHWWLLPHPQRICYKQLFFTACFMGQQPLMFTCVLVPHKKPIWHHSECHIFQEYRSNQFKSYQSISSSDLQYPAGNMTPFKTRHGVVWKLKFDSFWESPLMCLIDRFPSLAHQNYYRQGFCKMMEAMRGIYIWWDAF